MILKMYTVYDAAVQAYLTPFYMQSAGAAIRAFTDACNDPQHSFYKHPEDYTIFEMGEFDDQTGTIMTEDTYLALGRAIDFKEQYQFQGMDTQQITLEDIPELKKQEI